MLTESRSSGSGPHLRNSLSVARRIDATCLLVTAASVCRSRALRRPNHSHRQARDYEIRCASCHGSDMTGAKRRRSDLGALSRRQGNRRYGAQGSSRRAGADARFGVRQLLSEMRKLAGTNPAMATGGYTGSRRPRCRPSRFLHQSRGPAPGIGGNTPATIQMADGSSRTGILLGQSLTSAVLLENGNTNSRCCRATATCIARSRLRRSATG